MLYRKENRNIYLVIGLIITFFLFMLVSGAISIHHVSKNSSATFQSKSVK